MESVNYINIKDREKSQFEKSKHLVKKAGAITLKRVNENGVDEIIVLEVQSKDDILYSVVRIGQGLKDEQYNLLFNNLISKINNI